MELSKIKGNTYFIKYTTNIGVYTFKNKNCIVIDTGISNSSGRRIDQVLEENHLKPKYIINTHHHLDHCGGNKYFCENHPGVNVCTSEKTRVHFENHYIGSAVIFSGHFPKELEEKKYTKVDFALNIGLNKFNDEKFMIMSLKGHSDDQIGIITPDKVCFLGDSIFSSSILKKYSFPYLYNIQESIETLQSLKEIEADYFVISHAREVLKKDELCELADDNVNNINNYKEQILELLSQPMTREELLENIIVLNGLFVNFKQYHLYFSTLSSFITDLYDNGLIKCSIEDGKLYYYA